MLVIDKLTKCYRGRTAVDGLNLQVPQGQILGLLGPNGAGKSTTISMLAGVLRPTRGTVSVSGRDMGREAMAARRMVGLVPQELALYEELSARENLSFFGSLYGLRAKALAVRIEWALEIAGLRERANDVVAEFSGGMKRRLNLSAGLMHKPQLLLLDEPTVGVDPQSRNHIFRSIAALREEHRMTVVYSSHYMEEVQLLCDRVAIMDHGAIIADDDVTTLLANSDAGVMELDVVGDLQDALRVAEKFGAASIDGQKLRIIPRCGVGPLIVALEEEQFVIRGIRRIGDDLEGLFLALTGNQLRDS